MLTISHLSKDYATFPFALKDISFSVERGEMVAIIGHSGAGKSTLLRCINSLTEHNGKVYINGECLEEASAKNLRKIRTNIAMIFQDYNLVESLSVIENVLHGILGKISFFRSIFSLYTKKEKEKALSLIDAVGLASMPFRSCASLSGGQKQRVGIARAIMQEPILILADEPTSSLDINSSNIILNLLKNMCKERSIACIINLHQIDLAKSFADRIIALKKGEIVFNGIPSNLNEEVLKQIF